MKAFVLYGPNSFGLEQDWPTPKAKDDWAVVKVAFAGICGSDMPRFYKTGSYHPNMILGHEFSGVIAEAAPNGKLPVGTPVAIMPIIPCGTCNGCLTYNEPFQCEQYQFIGSRNDGGFAAYCLVKESNLFVLHDESELVQGAFIELLSVGLHAVRRSGITDTPESKKAVVFGAGPIGLSMAYWLQFFGHDVTVVDVRSYSLDIAKAIGIEKTVFFKDLNEKGFAYAFEASGAPTAITKAIEVMAPKGVFTVVGRNSNDTVIPTASFEWMMRREMTIKGCWGYNLAGEDEVMSKGIAAFDAKKLVSHLLKPEEVSDMLDKMWNHTCDFCKVLIDFTEEP